MKRLLVCTDFSESSDQALRAASEMHERNGGTVDVLYVSELGLHLDDVLSDSIKSTYRGALLSDFKESINTKMSAQMARCGCSANVIYREGQVDDVILAIANEGNHDLIIMGHGRKPFFKQLLGSNAAKVISHTPLAALIVKTPIKFGKIAGLVDESRQMDRVVLGTLDFYRNFQCQEAEFISLWMDFPEPFGNAEGGAKVQSRLKEEVELYANPSDKTSVRTEPTKELKLAYPIEKILKQDKIDVVVLKKFSEGNLKRVYIGSTTKRLLEIFEGNLLILPP
jgi:nucleotide-binding universal stress UspA family protein